jgi:hypothetical protein
MAEDVLYKSNFVTVTPSVARFGNTSYQIANIGSVSVQADRKWNPVAVLLLVLGLVFLVLGLWLLPADDVLAFAAMIGGIGLMIAGGVWETSYPIYEFRLFLKTSSSDFQVLVSRDDKYITSVEQALEEAFRRRA